MQDMNWYQKTAGHITLKIKNPMNTTEIGTVEITYDENGNARDAKFTPSLKISLTNKLLLELFKISGKDSEGIIRSNADLVFGQWFSKLNEIELADREKYHVVSHLQRCIKYDSGNVKTCIITYSFEPVNATTVN